MHEAGPQDFLEPLREFGTPSTILGPNIRIESVKGFKLAISGREEL